MTLLEVTSQCRNITTFVAAADDQQSDESIHRDNQIERPQRLRSILSSKYALLAHECNVLSSQRFAPSLVAILPR